MKKTIITLVAAALISLSACGGGDSEVIVYDCTPLDSEPSGEIKELDGSW